MLHQFISLTIIQTYLWKLDSLWQLSILKFPFIRSVLVFSFPYWLKTDHDHCDINWSRTKRPLQDISMASYDSWYNNDNFNLTGTRYLFRMRYEMPWHIELLSIIDPIFLCVEVNCSAVKWSQVFAQQINDSESYLYLLLPHFASLCFTTTNKPHGLPVWSGEQ